MSKCQIKKNTVKLISNCTSLKCIQLIKLSKYALTTRTRYNENQ